MKDHNAKQEYDAYQRLTQEHREIASRLTAVANEMAGYRDLPTDRHDEKAMSGSMVLEAFKKLIDLEQELMALLLKRQGDSKRCSLRECLDNKLTAPGGSRWHRANTRM